MVMTAESNFHVVVYIDRDAKKPWMQEPFFTTLRAMSARGLDAGGMMTVVENGETIVILPDRGVNVGRLLSDDRILMAEVRGPNGPRIEASVVKADEASHYGAVGVGWTKPPTA
jgi:hypothetical protein